MALTLEEIEKRINDSYEISNNVIDAVPEPMVTVRTSTYQHSPYIKQCIEGVLMQKTTFPIEFIIGEDFSTDGTREIVFEYAKKFPDLIRVFTADYNVGGKANGRRCIDASRGKYMAICEGDDYWTDPLKLQKQVDFLEANPNYSLCFHNSKIIHENSIRSDCNFCKLTKTEFDTQDIIRNSWFIPSQSMVFRLKYIKPLPLWSRFVFGGDLALHLILSSHGKLKYLDETMSVYRRQKSGLSQTHSPLFIQTKIMENLLYFNQHTNFKYNNLIQNRLQQIRNKLFINYLKEFWFSKKVILPLYHLIRN